MNFNLSEKADHNETAEKNGGTLKMKTQKIIIKCDYCGVELDASYTKCPFCGASMKILEQTAAKQKQKQKRKWVLFAFLSSAAVLLCALSFFLAARRNQPVKKELEITTESTYEELLTSTPGDVFQTGVHGKFLEQIFSKPLSSITWEEVARIKYLKPVARQTLYYSFSNSWDFESMDEFSLTVKTVHAASDNIAFDANALGYFIGAEELYVESAGGTVFEHCLESLPKLRFLSTMVTDYEELKNLKSLKSLEIHSSNGGSMAGLDSLENLEELSLDYTDYENLEMLLKLPKLKKLTLQRNRGGFPWDLNTISKLTGLKELSIQATGLKSLDQLASLNTLESLSISDCKAKTLSFLPRLSKLKALSITDCAYIKDLEFLASCPSLTSLTLDTENLKSCGFIGEMKNLTSLSLLHCYDLSFLSTLTGLKNLSLSQCDAGAALPYHSLCALESLSLDQCSGGIELEPAFSALSGLKKLASIAISNCQFRCSCDDLLKPPALKRLSLINSSYHLEPDSFSSLAGLDTLMLTDSEGASNLLAELPQMPNLRILNLHNSRLTDLDFLSKMPNLFFLDISGNEIENADAVENLAGLEYLYISENPLKDRSVLERISGHVCVND